MRSFGVLFVLMIDLQSLLLAGMISRAGHIFIGRDRPSGRVCGSDPDYDDLCPSRSRFVSFFSGHTALAVAGAALTCLHHQELPLWGGGAVEAVPCVTMVAAATATGILRISSDRHYATDVVFGAGVGLATGLLLPWLLHFREDTPPVLMAPWIDEGSAGAVLIGPLAI